LFASGNNPSPLESGKFPQGNILKPWEIELPPKELFFSKEKRCLADGAMYFMKANGQSGSVQLSLIQSISMSVWSISKAKGAI
jgi:hypothetical protein